MFKFIFLLFVSIFSLSYSKEDNHFITIEKATGDLYEYLSAQQIKLSIVPKFNIDPKKLYDFELTHGFKTYKIPLKCPKAERQHFSVLVTCDINLANVPLGTYLISKFNYTNITYISSALIKIKEVDDKKISDVKLVEAKEDLKEYQLNENSIYFNFNKLIYVNKLISIKVEDKDKNEYKIKINNCYNSLEQGIEMYCNVNIKLKAGPYKIIYVQYEKEIILPDKDIGITLDEDNLVLEYAEGTYARKVCAGKLNSLTFDFKSNVCGVFLSRIFFRNIKTNKIVS